MCTEPNQEKNYLSQTFCSPLCYSLGCSKAITNNMNPNCHPLIVPLFLLPCLGRCSNTFLTFPRMYSSFASEMGFEQFHLHMRPIQFEFAVHKEKTEKLPLFVTALLQNDSTIDRYSAAFSPRLAISEQFYDLVESTLGISRQLSYFTQINGPTQGSRPVLNVQFSKNILGKDEHEFRI